MVTIRSVNEIILSLVDFFKLVQPDLDVKPGTVARDLFVDAPANQLSLLYDELSAISDLQSFRLVSGSDLDKLAKNFGLSRKTSTASSGLALLTFASIDAPININRGASILSSNGASFSVQNGIALVPALSNFYKSVASKFKNDLNFVGIKDQFAVQVTVSASTFGTVGNIGKYSLNRANIDGISNVTNVNSFSGGNNQENDAVFRSRVLSTFGGSSIGTTLGYQNTALSTDGVLDALVVEPGDSLMTRDGTVVSKNTDGSSTIISEGSGGKVDVIILGSTLTENIDSFIYKDKSNLNDPSNVKNEFVLGQISGDENKTINRKRIDNIKAATLPAQPVDKLLEISGSLSGSNYKSKSVDSFGRVSGNYELIKDTGTVAGSPWGFDTFHWIDNKVSLFEEDRIKGQFNGQDPVSFTDVLEIPLIQQNILIVNENSTVTYDRSIIQLLHAPATNVTRVFNVNTGERYLVSNQNVDGTTSTNTTGRIKISGNTLPTSSDVLQVDYNWVVSYDQYSDYDGLSLTSNLRSVTDSIDWGYSSLVKKEKIIFEKNASNTFFVGNVAHPISSVVKVNYVNEVSGIVAPVTSGVFTGRLSVVLSGLINAVNVVDSIKLKNSSKEVYATAQNDGSFSVATTIVGIEIQYIATIILPSDTIAVDGNIVSIILDSVDVYNITSSTGNFNDNQITFPVANIDTAAEKLTLTVDYIANTQSLLSATITSFPVSRLGNGLEFNKNIGFNNNFISSVFRKEVLVIQQNISNQFYIDLTLSSLESTLVLDQIVSVIRLSDNRELWNIDNVGSITTNISNNNFQIIFNGLNTPALGDRVLIVYFANDIHKFQPFTFNNYILKTRIATLQHDISIDSFTTKIQDFTNSMNVSFKIFDANSDVFLLNRSDGYITSSTDDTAIFGCAGFNFSSITGIVYKKIKIFNESNPNNNGTYEITGFNVASNTLTISTALNNVSKRQVSIIRLVDSQDLWSNSCTITPSLNTITIPFTGQASAGDKALIIYFNCDNLKQTITRLSVNVSDQITNSGVLTVIGNTITKSADIVFTATNNGLKQNITEAIKKALKLNSKSSVPSNIKLVKISKLEKVTTVSANSDEVLSILNSYNLFGTKIRDNSYFLYNFIEDTLLNDLEFILPNTTNNSSNSVMANHIPKIGDKLRISFYYLTTGDSENITFTRNGTLFTNKTFALIDRIFISSGFSASQSTKITISTFNQPIVGSRYKIFYDYMAPKANERIVIRYNYNTLISNTTFNIETSRPINADVIVKQAKEISLDLTMNVVIASEKKSSSTLVLQSLRDALTAALNQNTLNGVIDNSDLINTAYSVEGIDRARILFFNKSGSIGQALSIQAQKNEYFVAGIITINEETR